MDTTVTESNVTSIVQELVDRHLIRECLIRYVRGTNRADEELIHSTYHEDSWEEHATFSGSGHEWASLPSRKSADRRMLHIQIGQSTIELDGDAASVETYYIAHMKNRSSGGGLGGPTAQTDENGEPLEFMNIIVGRYLDRFERRNGEWKVRVRKVVADWAFETTEPPSHPILETFHSGARDETDLSYGISDFVVPQKAASPA